MSGKPVETSIKNKLSQQLSPKYLDVINESPHHNVPAGSETHFKVVVVTDQFENKPLLQVCSITNSVGLIFYFFRITIFLFWFV